MILSIYMMLGLPGQKSKKAEELLVGYLKEEELLRKKIKDPNIEFGYIFGFPPRQQKQSMQVVHPKESDYIVISLGIQIPDVFIQALNDIEPQKKVQFYIDIRKFLLSQNFLFRFELALNRYHISDQLYFSEGGIISKDRFFKRVRNIYNASQYCTLLLEEYCMDKVDKKYLKPSDLTNP
ncbi:MAG: DUF2299 family protein, partial [Promethearchaeota archaeon]